MGRLGAHTAGSEFSVPQAPDPNAWRIISPGLQEGVGPAGAGRITHIRDGALSIATHVFFRPDMVVPVFSGAASRVSVELAPDSGTLWVQIGDAPSQFVQLRPGAMRGGAAGTQWTPVQGNEFVLAIENGELTVGGNGEVLRIGSASPGRLELSATEDWPRVQSILIQDAEGTTLFSSNFESNGATQKILDVGTLLGVLIGAMLASLLIPFSWTGLSAAVVGLIPVLLVLGQPSAVWLASVERLYLSSVQPSQWAAWVLLVSLVPVGTMSAVSLSRMVAHKVQPPRFGATVWCLIGVGSILVSSPSLSLGLAVSVGCMALGALRAGNKAPAIWWAVDAVGWVPLALLGPDLAAPWVVVWRMVGVLGTAQQWVDSSPRRAVDALLIALCLVPFALESAVSGSALGQAWRMDRLSSERPNEKGWEDPRPSWEGRCGSDDPTSTRTIAFAGGSSVGGAYQFGDEPEAFFPAVAHRALCSDLPEGAGLKTQNFGDGDLNTFTISRTIEQHLLEADVLVLYVGVNDVLTRQNTQTRKEREAARSSRGLLGSGLSGWASRSSVMVGLSLWNRGIDDPTTQGVADVPMADAKENHESIIAAARAQSKTVILMTEHVQQGLKDSLRPYAQMQQHFVSDDVIWIDSSVAFEGMAAADVLVDRNHLSRAGNDALGVHVAKTLDSMLYGSTR